MKTLTRIATFRDFIGESTVTYKRTSTPTHKITSSRIADQVIRPYFADIMDDHEEVKIMHLNRQNFVVNIDHVSKGGDAGCMVPIPTICRNVLHIKAQSIICFHNHPSGNLRPSEDDKNICKKLKAAMQTIELQMLDFVIITSEGYFSFVDEGIL